MIRLVVVGYGSAGARHAINARASGCYVEVIDTNEERCARARADGFSLHIGGEPDAVVVAVPANLHLRVISEWQARHPSVPMLVEKPLALSANGVPHIRASHVRVAYNWRFHPDVQQWAAGWNHLPRRIELTCVTRMREWPGRNYGPPLLECSHELDLLLWLRHPVVPKLQSAWSPDEPESARLLFNTGDVVSLHWESPHPSGRYYTARFHGDGSALTHAVEPRMDAVLAQSYRNEMSAFVASVLNPAQRHTELATVGDSMWVFETCAAAEQELRKRA